MEALLTRPWARWLALALLGGVTLYCISFYRHLEIEEERQHLRQYAALLGEHAKGLEAQGRFSAYCWEYRIDDQLQGALVDRQGRRVASCQSTDAAGRATLLGKSGMPWQGGGDLASPGGRVEGTTAGWLVAYAEVRDWPEHFIVLALPEAAAVGHWPEYMQIVVGLALVSALLLAFGPGVYLRQLHRMAAEKQALEQWRQTLQNRIQTVTRDLRQQKEDAEKANASKSRFLAAATHDLRQPLAALNLFAADLDRQVRTADREVLVRLASRINASARGLRTLIDALLDFSCIDVEKIRPNLRVCELNQLFSILERTFSCAAEEKRIGLSFRDTRQLAYTDPILLERLLGNLIANAIAYTYQGRVLVAARHRGEHVCVEVFDTGIGIPEAQLHHIFEEFYQVENTAREHNKGLGLGLAIVTKLAQALDARVDVQSVPGKGSRFTVILPALAPGELQRLFLLRPSQGDGSGAIETPLYVVGDAPDLLPLKMQLMDWGYDVVQVPTLDALPTEQGAGRVVAILDLDHDGALLHPESAPRQLVALGSPLPGMPPWVHHLPKPVRPARLRTLLNRLLEPPAS